MSGSPPLSSREMQAFLAAVRGEPGLREALVHEATLPAEPALAAAGLPEGYEALEPVLAAHRIQALYRHQRRALRHVDAGADVVLATPTASGKTLVYHLPVLRQLQDDPEARALYVFPIKALEHDQRKRIEEDALLLRAAGLAAPTVEIYDGDTPPARRKQIRSDPPNVLITTPDMLHLGILPHHAQWQRFFAGLRTLVIDELHTYRGVFGSHVAQVVRRVLRAAAFHGARPQIVAASATIANPGELAGQLCGRPFEVVQTDGAPRTRRHVLMLNPGASPYTTAAQLFRLAVRAGLRTIAFTKARRVTELLHTWIAEAEPGLASQISSYRSGFLPRERREIEQRLFSGALRGVISTSALEMGIDVGGLDVCILVGYPGSQMATWQRAGRVGRTREAAVALVAQRDALDQYVVTHPELFLGQRYEHAVVDPANPEILGAHLPCAAAEAPLREKEAWLQEPGTLRRAQELEEEGSLLCAEGGAQWFAARRLPHRHVSLRNGGRGYTIETEGGDGERAALIGHIGGGRVYAEGHEGAVYLHRGQSFLVTQLDLDARRVRVRAEDLPYYTQTLSEKETEILSRERERPCRAFRLSQGRVRVTTTTTGYERRHVHSQEILGSEPLDLPPEILETEGIWLELPEVVREGIRERGGHPMGGIHATEHAVLGLFPLFALCDRHDVAGISYTAHPQLKRPAIFLYDGAAGGVGLCASLYDRLETLLEATLQRIEDCECEEGCPACVQSPKCGSGNRPLDKAASQQLLRWLLEREPLPEPAPDADAEDESANAVAAAAPAPAARPALAAVPDPRIAYFDLETQRSAEDVGGWHNAHLMRLAVAVVYDSRLDRFVSYGEAEAEALVDHLVEADLVVGFNVNRFDYRVLRGYTDRNLEQVTATFDVLDAIRDRIGFRLGLGHLAEETLGAAKSADGLVSLAWWKAGRVDEVRAYCERDVALLRDLFQHALRHQHLLFRTRSGERVRLPAPWRLAEIVEAARGRRTPDRSARGPGAR